MKFTLSWIKYGMIGSLILAAICSITLVAEALTSQRNTKAGIATLRFNFTGVTFLDHPLKTKRLPEPGIIQSLEGGVQSAANGIATKIPGAISQIHSAASSLSTTIPDLIEARIPRNVSIGTSKFCIGLVHDVSCNDLPLNVSSLIPTDVRKYLPPGLTDIESLNGALMKITPKDIYGSLIPGLVLMLIMILVTIGLMFPPLACLPGILGLRAVKFGVLLFLGMICCVLFIIPVVFLSILDSKAKELPSWIQVEQGEVGRLTRWSLCFVVIAAVTSALAPIVL